MTFLKYVQNLNVNSSVYIEQTFGSFQCASRLKSLSGDSCKTKERRTSWNLQLTSLFSLVAQVHSSYFPDGEKESKENSLYFLLCLYFLYLCLLLAFLTVQRKYLCSYLRPALPLKSHFMSALPSQDLDPGIPPFSLVSSAFPPTASFLSA